MLHQRRRLLFLASPALLFVLFLVGCNDKSLQQTAKAMADISAANLAVENTVITAQQNGSITAEQARYVIGVSLQVAQAGKQVDAAIRGISQLSATDKTKILAILQPVISSVTAAVSQTNLITNITARNEILAALTTINSALAVARVALGG